MEILKNRTIYYYFILLLILVTWTNVDSLPPFPLRIAYLFAVVVPIISKRSILAPEILLTFVVISGSSYAVSYMPVDGLYISIVLGFLYIICRPKVHPISFPIGWWILAFCAIVVDLLHGGGINFSLKLFAILFASKFIPKADERTLQLITGSIMLISLVIALEFLIVGGNFNQTVSTIEGEIDRKGWADPNYFGSVLGYGVIAGFIALQKWPCMNNKLKLLTIITITLSLYAILTTASRGVFIAIVSSIIILMLLGPGNYKKKLSFLMAILFGGFIFYQLGFFDLIFLRLDSDAGNVGGRTEIWIPRLYAFFKECNLLEQCFGLGFRDARFLGTGILLGSHNDYLAILTSYGFVGFLCLISILFLPYVKAREYRKYVLVATMYMAICMISIEPFSGGHWAIYYFYIYILAMSEYRTSKISTQKHLSI